MSETQKLKLEHIDRTKKSPEQVQAQVNRINVKLGERIVGLAVQAAGVSGVRGEVTDTGTGGERVRKATVRLPKTLEHGDKMSLETTTSTPEATGRQRVTTNTSKIGDWHTAHTRTTPTEASGVIVNQDAEVENKVNTRSTEFTLVPELTDSGFIETHAVATTGGNEIAGQYTHARQAEHDYEVPMVDQRVVENLSQMRQDTTSAKTQLSNPQ